MVDHSPGIDQVKTFALKGQLFGICHTQFRMQTLYFQAPTGDFDRARCNVDAMKALASVLYREDKIEESAAILDKLPKTN